MIVAETAEVEQNPDILAVMGIAAGSCIAALVGILDGEVYHKTVKVQLVRLCSRLIEDFGGCWSRLLAAEAVAGSRVETWLRDVVRRMKLLEEVDHSPEDIQWEGLDMVLVAAGSRTAQAEQVQYTEVHHRKVP